MLDLHELYFKTVGGGGGAMNNLYEMSFKRLKIRKYIYSDPKREERVLHK